MFTDEQIRQATGVNVESIWELRDSSVVSYALGPDPSAISMQSVGERVSSGEWL